jgi:hypothetical protein
MIFVLRTENVVQLIYPLLPSMIGNPLSKIILMLVVVLPDSEFPSQTIFCFLM